MKYTLDTLPVLDAYRENGECPLCRLRISCEDQYVDSMLGAAYMEPDCRVKTNEVGFCTRHFELMFERRNRLGLALMTHTQLQNLDRIEKELEWFTLKYDFRNADKPWGNSRDAVERSINKLMGACVGEEAKMPAHND